MFTSDTFSFTPGQDRVMVIPSFFESEAAMLEFLGRFGMRMILSCGVGALLALGFKHNEDR